MTSTQATATVHKIRWFVWAGSGVDRVKIPRQATMRGQWGYDVECSCGWATHTGGATWTYVASEVSLHKWLAANEVAS
jgi:hypothetical protein